MNTQIKDMIRQSHFFQYEIANKIRISETSFCRWFRNELSEEQKNKIKNAIEQLTKENATQ